MKRILAIIMTLCILMSLCACGSETTDDNGKTPTTEMPTTEMPTTEMPTTEPIVMVPVLQAIKVSWLDDYEYTVGKNMEINEFGQIKQVMKRYEIIDVLYDEEHRVSTVNITDKDDGTVGYESFSYENGIPVKAERDLKDGFTYTYVKDITNEVDDAGRVVKVVENILYTDPDNGTTKKEIDIYEIEYDDNGYVTQFAFYSDGDFDHTTEITYDEYGNVLVFSSKGSDGSEYLRFEFSYELVEEGSVTPITLDPFTIYQNVEYIVGPIL